MNSPNLAAEPITLHGKTILPGASQTIDYHTGALPSGHHIHTLIHIFRGARRGPCILLLAGMHGDEINGVEILRSALESGHFEGLEAGTVIVAPLLNVYGFINFSRDLADGKDINRSFPGSAKGSLASRLAWQVSQDLLPLADYVIDLHTGGASRFNHPQVRYSEDEPESRALAEVFAAPFLVHKPVIEKSLRETGTRMGKPVIVYEAGESLRYNTLGIREGILGIRRVLNHFGLKAFDSPESTSVWLTESTWVRATQAGLFLWSRASGERVQKGDLLGDIHDPHVRSHHPVLAPRDAWIIGHNNAAVISLGDALFHLGWPSTD
jgi:uncharacterized protein